MHTVNNINYLYTLERFISTGPINTGISTNQIFFISKRFLPYLEVDYNLSDREGRTIIAVVLNRWLAGVRLWQIKKKNVSYNNMPSLVPIPYMHKASLLLFCTYPFHPLRIG